MSHRLLAALLLASTAGTALAADFDKTPGKLPKDAIPDAYRIDLVPDIAALTFHGTVAVDLHTTAPTASLTLNQAGLTIASATLEDGATAAIREDQKAQTATLTFAKPIPAGKHTLKLAYMGPIPTSPAGLYADDYVNAGAKTRLLVTQFEATDARRMLPCWDEPSFKARFTLAVTVPDTLTALSNTPLASRTQAGPGMVRLQFAETPRMSSYLLAFAAGDLAALHGKSGQTEIGVFAPNGREAQGQLALNAATELLGFYNSYFGVPYPLPKLDLIAVPGNYAAGAMENWGAITFIDNALLVDPASSSSLTRESVYTVVAHEMAHQWSGDLVTMAWWDNLWLNEGFATWMQYKASDHFNPSWQLWTRQHDARELAMGEDARPTTHPIQVPVRDESEAESVFDAISYQKGSQVIRMIEDWIGPDQFRAGMRAYMAAHQYANATSADLWQALAAASGKDVARVAARFTEQPGVPLLHVTRRCAPAKAAKGVNSITLTQDRFTIHDPKAAKLQWVIPVHLGGPGLATQTVLLEDAPVTLPLAACDTPIKANLGEAGYFRTEYDAASLKPLAAHLPELAAADRANLLGDQFALFLAGRAPLESYLDLLTRLGAETDFGVWQDTLGRLLVLDRSIANPDLRAQYHAWASKLLHPAFDRLGWDAKPGEPVTDSLLRPNLIAALGRYDDPAVVAQARTKFTAFLASPASLAPDLRGPVLDIAGHSADRATYDKLMALAVAAPGTEEKLRYLSAAAASPDPALLAETIKAAADGRVPNGRIVGVLARAAGQSGNPDEVWRQVVAAQATLRPHLTADRQGTLLPAVARFSSSTAVLRALWADPASKASLGAKHQAAQAAEAIETAAELRQRVQPALSAWLKGR